jgi:hypothetical protein
MAGCGGGAVAGVAAVSLEEFIIWNALVRELRWQCPRSTDTCNPNLGTIGRNVRLSPTPDGDVLIVPRFPIHLRKDKEPASPDQDA